MNIDYKKKYLKYKRKYLNVKKYYGGADDINIELSEKIKNSNISLIPILKTFASQHFFT